MCLTGSALYLTWVSLVPQVKYGESAASIRSKMATKTPESEKARLAYESHWKSCRLCQEDLIKGFKHHF